MPYTCDSKRTELLAMFAVLLLTTAALFASVEADATTTTNLLWPLPHSVKFGSTVFALDPSTFVFQGVGAGGEGSIIKDAFRRYQYLIFQTKTPFYPSGATGEVTQTLTSITVDVASANEILAPDTVENCEYFLR